MTIIYDSQMAFNHLPRNIHIRKNVSSAISPFIIHQLHLNVSIQLLIAIAPLPIDLKINSLIFNSLTLMSESVKFLVFSKGHGKNITICGKIDLG